MDFDTYHRNGTVSFEHWEIIGVKDNGDIVTAVPDVGHVVEQLNQIARGRIHVILILEDERGRFVVLGENKILSWMKEPELVLVPDASTGRIYIETRSKEGRKHPGDNRTAAELFGIQQGTRHRIVSADGNYLGSGDDVD
jgi:hypothetical protein